jgi:hypothetical protein
MLAAVETEHEFFVLTQKGTTSGCSTFLMSRVRDGTVIRRVTDTASRQHLYARSDHGK